MDFKLLTIFTSDANEAFRSPKCV